MSTSREIPFNNYTPINRHISFWWEEVWHDEKRYKQVKTYTYTDDFFQIATFKTHCIKYSVVKNYLAYICPLTYSIVLTNVFICYLKIGSKGTGITNLNK